MRAADARAWEQLKSGKLDRKGLDGVLLGLEYVLGESDRARILNRSHILSGVQ